MIVKRIISLAIILTLSVSSHTSSCVRAFTFTPPVVHVAYPSVAKSSSSSMSPTRLFVLQPSKGGIIVEAKSDFVARDILIDSFMGRDSSSSSSGEKEPGWKEPQQDLDFSDNFAPNESAWVQSPNSRRMGQQVQQQQRSQFQSASMPVPPPMPPQPQPIIMQPQQQPVTPSSTTSQPAISNTSGNTKSKLPDPSLMKLSDIQGELSLRRIDYNDCFDRTSLEARLREARLAMMKPITSSPKTSLSTPRSSPAEQAIFSSSFASTRSASTASPSASPSTRVAAA